MNVTEEVIAKYDDNAVYYECCGCTYAIIDGKCYSVGPFLFEFYDLIEEVRDLPYGSTRQH